MGWIGDCQAPIIKNALIRWWIKHYNINMEEALEPFPENYTTFNAFFTRQLKKDARVLVNDEAAIISPADGFISQQGDIANGKIIQAKGFNFTVEMLLGDDTIMANQFAAGKFSTIYLSPSDYHRVHMPCAGTLKKMIYVPGRLFSVNRATSEHVPQLFARNERVICLFDTAVGPMALVLVGAMIVASIETVWAGEVTPIRRRIQITDYQIDDKTALQLNQGDEMGRFKLGSTVIMLFGQNCLEWNTYIDVGDKVKLGQSLGRVNGHSDKS